MPPGSEAARLPHSFPTTRELACTQRQRRLFIMAQKETFFECYKTQPSSSLACSSTTPPDRVIRFPPKPPATVGPQAQSIDASDPLLHLLESYRNPLILSPTSHPSATTAPNAGSRCLCWSLCPEAVGPAPPLWETCRRVCWRGAMILGES